MKLLLILALVLATGAVPFEGAEGTREPRLTLEDPAPADRPTSEEDWRPFPYLRYDDWGASFQRRNRAGDPAASEREPFHWHEATLPERLKFRSLLDPLEAFVDLGRLHGSWDHGASEVSFTTDLSTVANSLGAPVGAGVFLGICVDLLEFPETEGGRLPLLDPKHGTLRPSDVSTGFGVTLGF